MIQNLQKHLAENGCYAGITDGFYGGGTERSVSTFQHDSRLPIARNDGNKSFQTIPTHREVVETTG